MMTTKEISRFDWMSFLDSLTRQHVDEPVRIEVLRPDIGAQLEVNDLPLDGISAEVKGAHATITIAAGTELDQHIAHVISDPVSVKLACDATGEDEALEIVDADRTVTLVFFDEPKGWSAHS